VKAILFCVNIWYFPLQNFSLFYYSIKCLTNCARCDWSVPVHYSSIKHAAYVTRVLYRVIIMHAAYVTSFSLAFYKWNKKLHPCALLSYISTFFKNTLKNFRMLIELNNTLGCIFYFFSIVQFCSVICQVVAHGRLKTKESFKLLALKVVAAAYKGVQKYIDL